jgi:D-glycero-D-manno-heptose 1,7-bisphosphate phosphatase
LKAIFLDRDGVINKKTESGYVLKWDEFQFLPGVIDAIKLINKMNIPIYVISNQSCVGRRMVKLEEVQDINSRMLKELEKQGAHIEGVYFCPHHPDDGCDCRKPKTGLFKQAAKEHPIDLADSWFIGDSETDEEAGKNLGCHTYLVKEGENMLPVIKTIIGQLSDT